MGALFELIAMTEPLWVEGESELETVGEFRGRVAAIGVREYDPVAAPRGERPYQDFRPEGLEGWGTTHFLVCDESKPAPVWVAKHDVRRHRLGHGAPAALEFRP